eukprot:3182434-Prymnesium_polylepis.1
MTNRVMREGERMNARAADACFSVHASGDNSLGRRAQERRAQGWEGERKNGARKREVASECEIALRTAQAKPIAQKKRWVTGLVKKSLIRTSSVGGKRG